MKIAILKERDEHEYRVAITPAIVKKLAQHHIDICVETNAGISAGLSDAAYQAEGATIVETASECLSGADILLTVRPPAKEALATLPEKTIIIGMLSPYERDDLLPAYSEKEVTTFALELLPRISRAQSMDVLSSQSNLAGYRAVIDAVSLMTKATPMMMTAAGTVAPAKALILGAGVAGLQAIATAKRLGTVVSAFDVRPAVKEQVESLGGKFIEVKEEELEKAETKGGYAKEMSEEYKRKQRALIHETLKTQDFAITTALIPGKPAPTLITEEMVKDMKPGSVIIDLAASHGGNCPLTEPDEIVEYNGVRIVGFTNLPARVATDASQLYARNLYNFITTLLLDEHSHLHIQWEDELVTGCLLTKEGRLVHPQFKEEE